jgi:hypothetical protein
MPNPQNIEKHKFKKGQSGNPNGRPKKIPDLREALADVLAEEKDHKTALNLLLRKMRAEALKGNVRAMELLLKYAYPTGVASSAIVERLRLVWGDVEQDGAETDGAE